MDQKVREAILNDEGNILVSASAGSGKTTIMVKKMAIELNKIKDHRTIAAITFTVKATNEIRKKAFKLIEKPFSVMTNDSFIEKEIIRPFITDALGITYPRDYTVDYDGKYKFDNFSSGLEQLSKTKILGSFYDNKLNFNFQVALTIIRGSRAAQEYIKSKYAVLFVDEYQDSDYDMNLFFLYLKNSLGIKLFIVGDSKQAIYLWRGAMSNIFEQLISENFNSYELLTNFRCHEEIENFANLFHNDRYHKVITDNVEHVIFKKNSRRNSIVEDFNMLVETNLIDLNKEITIISNFNNDARSVAEQLKNEGFDFAYIPRTPIDEGLPNGQLLKELALYCKNVAYNIYDLLENSNIDERNQTRYEVERIICDLKKSETLLIKKTDEILSELSEYLGISISKDEILKFHESVSNSIYEMAFQLNEKKYKVMTVFSSKGLEFDQVISFSRYYRIYNNEHIHNHYVCITRAKEKFIMILDDANYYNYFEQLIKEKGISVVEQVVKCVD